MNTSNLLQIVKVRVSGQPSVHKLCNLLIGASQWFAVVPLPDDEWEIEVKSENLNRLCHWVAS